MARRVQLEGELVRLEPLTVEHACGLLAAATESRATFRYTLVPADEESTLRYIVHALDDERNGRCLPFAVRSLLSDRIAGSTRFLDLEYWTGSTSGATGSTRGDERGTPSVCEIGSTWLAESAQRTGINTEAKLLMLSHAFDTWGVHRVTLKTDARNQRSRAAIARIGGVFEGVRRAHMPAADSGIRDTAYFSILAAEWPAARRHLLELLDHYSD
ncbi:MAG: GNAT N-acetyltransferase [Actinobacteria bacterium]|nr:GNAT N-acetyltransferase [Actinomycetota bacterium]